MKFEVGRTSVFAALLIVIAGYALIFHPLESSISQRYAEIDAARANLEQSLAVARRIPALERERASVNARLRHAHVSDGRAATVDRFLRTVAGVSRRDNVAVESVAAGRGQAAPASRAAPATLLEELPLEIRVRGRYADIIRAVRDLNGGDAAARISLASFGNADRRRGDRPQLNAAFHVTLLRETDDTTPSVAHPL